MRIMSNPMTIGIIRCKLQQSSEDYAKVLPSTVRLPGYASLRAWKACPRTEGACIWLPDNNVSGPVNPDVVNDRLLENPMCWNSIALLAKGT